MCFIHHESAFSDIANMINGMKKYQKIESKLDPSFLKLVFNCHVYNFNGTNEIQHQYRRTIKFCSTNQIENI